MPNTEDKVHYNLKNVHYAKITAVASDGTPTYAAPVAIPGGVSISLEQQGEITKKYADGIVYWQTSSNNGYEGDLEIVRIPESFRTDILGETLDATKQILVENANNKGSAFALLFEFDGDINGTRHVFYNCSCTRPGISGKTTEGSKETDDDTLKVSAISLKNGDVKASSTANTTSAALAAWYTEVQMPTTV